MLGAHRCIPMGIMELLLLDVSLDLEVKPELIRPDLGAKDGEFPTSMRDSRPESTMSQNLLSRDRDIHCTSTKL